LRIRICRCRLPEGAVIISGKYNFLFEILSCTFQTT
jgi:hypothetical protein